MVGVDTRKSRDSLSSDIALLRIISDTNMQSAAVGALPSLCDEGIGGIYNS